MTLRKAFFWFWSTLLIGALTTSLFTPFIHIRSLYQHMLSGLVLASVAELGFFSFLIFHWLFHGMFHQKITVYYYFLFGLMLVVGLNFMYFAYKRPLFEFILLTSVLLSFCTATALIKAKWTQRAAFTPTLFFMIVATVIEANPSLNSEGFAPILIIMQTLIVLLACNAWQILNLHRWAKTMNT